MPEKVKGSKGLTPKSIDASRRAPRAESTAPMTTPAIVNRTAPPTTRRKTSRRVAPSAMRMPISLQTERERIADQSVETAGREQHADRAGDGEDRASDPRGYQAESHAVAQRLRTFEPHLRIDFPDETAKTGNGCCRRLSGPNVKGEL